MPKVGAHGSHSHTGGTGHSGKGNSKKPDKSEGGSSHNNGKPPTDNTKGKSTGEGIDITSDRPGDDQKDLQAAYDRKEAQQQRFEDKLERINQKGENEMAKFKARCEEIARTSNEI